MSLWEYSSKERGGGALVIFPLLHQVHQSKSNWQHHMITITCPTHHAHHSCSLDALLLAVPAMRHLSTAFSLSTCRFEWRLGGICVRRTNRISATPQYPHSVSVNAIYTVWEHHTPLTHTPKGHTIPLQVSFLLEMLSRLQQITLHVQFYGDRWLKKWQF